MTANATEQLRIGSAESASSNWTSTVTGGDEIYVLNQDLGSPVDTRYQTFNCDAANDGQTVEWSLHPIMKFGLELIKTVQIRVRYQYQNWSNDTVSVTATVRNGLGNAVGNSLVMTAANNNVTTATSTLFTFTGGSEPSRADVEDWSLRLECAVTESGPGDATDFRLIGFEVDVNYDYNNEIRQGPELLYVSDVDTETTGYVGYVNGITFTLPAGVNRKIISFWLHEGDKAVTGGASPTCRYNNATSSSANFDWWQDSSTHPNSPSQLTGDQGLTIEYWDVDDADTGSKTIYYRCTNNLTYSSPPVHFFFIVLGNTEVGNPFGTTYGQDVYGTSSGLFTTDDRTLNTSDSPNFNDDNSVARFMITCAYSEGETEATGRWMFDFTDDGHKLIAPTAAAGGEEFGGDTDDFSLGTDHVLIGLRAVQERGDTTVDLSRDSAATSNAPAFGVWFRNGVPAPALDTVDTDDIIVRGQGAAVLDGDLDGAQSVTMQGSGVAQTITSKTATQINFTFAQGDMKFGTNTCEVLVNSPGVPTP